MATQTKKYYIEKEFEYPENNRDEVYTKAIEFMRTKAHADRFRKYSILEQDNRFLVRYHKDVQHDTLS